MCGVIGQEKLQFKDVTRLQGKAKRALAERIIPGGFTPNYNIWTGMQALVITNQEPDHYQAMTFGLTPSWASKKMYLFNARAEGKENPGNDPEYCGQTGIFKMPSFRNPIKKKRCLVPVDYFIEGTVSRRLEEPYVIRRKDAEPFVLAGVWDEWVDQETGEIHKSYSILTTAANRLLRSLPHHRSPLILHGEQLALWLEDDTPQERLTDMMRPGESDDFMAVRVSPAIKKKRNEPPVPAPEFPDTPTLF